MTFKTSLFNKGLIKSDIKRFWFVSAIYGLLLFFILPLNHVMQNTSVEKFEWKKKMLLETLNLFSYRNDFQVFLICIVPVAMAVLLFRYLQNTKAAAMMHSLPCTRTTHYFSHFTSGALLLILPVLLNGIILILLHSTTPLEKYHLLTDILQWLGTTVLFNVLFYTVAVFVGMFTGSSVAQIVFTYILHILPAGICLLVDFNIEHLFYGYGSRSIDENLLIDNLPLLKILSQASDGMSGRQTIGYIIATIFLFIAANYLYKIRNLECATDIIAFPITGPIFKYGVTICSMLLSRAYFYSISDDRFSMLVFGYLLGASLGYWISEMLIQKSFRVWNSYKGYAAYMAALAIILTLISTDALGYVRRIPDPEQVEQVYFGYSISQWQNFVNGNFDKNTIAIDGLPCIMNDNKNIENIIMLHKELIKKPYSKTGTQRYILYELKNGKHLIRRYFIDEDRYADVLKPVYESLEYKKSIYPLLSQEPENIQRIEIFDGRIPKNSVTIADSMEIKELLPLLKKDFSQTTFEELTDYKYTFSQISIILNNNKKNGEAITHYYTLKDSYHAVIEWLKEKGYFEKAIITPERIRYVVLEEIPDSKDRTVTPKRIEITDTKLINELLDINEPQPQGPYGNSVIVGFHFKDGDTTSQFQGYINKDTPMSEQLKSYVMELID